MGKLTYFSRSVDICSAKVGELSSVVYMLSFLGFTARFEVDYSKLVLIVPEISYVNAICMRSAEDDDLLLWLDAQIHFIESLKPPKMTDLFSQSGA